MRLVGILSVSYDAPLPENAETRVDDDTWVSKSKPSCEGKQQPDLNWDILEELIKATAFLKTSIDLITKSSSPALRRLRSRKHRVTR